MGRPRSVLTVDKDNIYINKEKKKGHKVITNRNDLRRPTCHDYIERNDIPTPRIQMKGLEGSGSH
jgi:hypothetical protein